MLYFVVRKKMSWNKADKFCREYGGHLTSMKSEKVEKDII
jgi:hypothetical protein